MGPSPRRFLPPWSAKLTPVSLCATLTVREFLRAVLQAKKCRANHCAMAVLKTCIRIWVPTTAGVAAVRISDRLDSARLQGYGPEILTAISGQAALGGRDVTPCLSFANFGRGQIDIAV